MNADNIDSKFQASIETPIGFLILSGTDDTLSSIEFKDNLSIDTAPANKYLSECKNQIEHYFKGTLKSFDLNLNPNGTEFQKRVWDLLLRVPYGETRSYLWQAEQMHSLDAIRAIAGANGHNPIPIIIPCHRIIGSNGSLTGYAGGLWRKKWLLDHEKKYSGFEAQLDFHFNE